MEQTPDMTTDEMIEVLKGIARDGKNGAARIAAIRELRAIGANERTPAEGFAALFAVDNPGRVKTKRVA